MSQATNVFQQALDAMEQGQDFDLTIDFGEGKITIPRWWYTKEELEKLAKEQLAKDQAKENL